jgi:hypothetical protein
LGYRIDTDERRQALISYPVRMTETSAATWIFRGRGKVGF